MVTVPSTVGEPMLIPREVAAERPVTKVAGRVDRSVLTVKPSVLSGLAQPLYPTLDARRQQGAGVRVPPRSHRHHPGAAGVPRQLQGRPHRRQGQCEGSAGRCDGVPDGRGLPSGCHLHQDGGAQKQLLGRSVSPLGAAARQLRRFRGPNYLTALSRPVTLSANALLSRSSCDLETRLQHHAVVSARSWCAGFVTNCSMHDMTRVAAEDLLICIKPRMVTCPDLLLPPVPAVGWCQYQPASTAVTHRPG